MHHYPDLGSASDCLKQIFSQFEELPCHQQGISALSPQILFREETRGAIGKFAGCFLRLWFRQCAKKVASNSPGLVDFAIRLVNFVLNLPDGQVNFFDEFKLQRNFEINSAHQNVFGASWNDFWASYMLVYARMASFKNDFLCTLLH